MKFAIALNLMAIQLAMGVGTESSGTVLTTQEAPVEDVQSASNIALNITAMGQPDLEVDEAGFLLKKKKKKYTSPSTPSSQSWPSSSSSTHHSSSSGHHSWSHDSVDMPLPPTAAPTNYNPPIGNPDYGHTDCIGSSPSERCAVYQTSFKYNRARKIESYGVNDGGPRRGGNKHTYPYESISGLCQSACGVFAVCPMDCPDIHAIEAYCGMPYDPDLAPPKPTRPPTDAPTMSPTPPPSHKPFIEVMPTTRKPSPAWPTHKPTHKPESPAWPTYKPTNEPPTMSPAWPTHKPGTPATHKPTHPPTMSPAWPTGGGGWGGSTPASGGSTKKSGGKKKAHPKYSFSAETIQFSEECGFCVDTCRSDCIEWVSSCCPCASAKTVIEYLCDDYSGDQFVADIGRKITDSEPIGPVFPIDKGSNIQSFYSAGITNSTQGVDFIVNKGNGIGIEFTELMTQSKYEQRASLLVIWPQKSFYEPFDEEPLKWMYNENREKSEDYVYFEGSERDYKDVKQVGLAELRLVFKDSTGWHIAEDACTLSSYQAFRAAAPTMKYRSYDPWIRDISNTKAGTTSGPSKPSFNCIEYVGFELYARAKKSTSCDEFRKLQVEQIDTAAQITEQLANITESLTAPDIVAPDDSAFLETPVLEQDAPVTEQDATVTEQDASISEQDIKTQAECEGTYKAYVEKFAVEAKTITGPVFV